MSQRLRLRAAATVARGGHRLRCDMRSRQERLVKGLRLRAAATVVHGGHRLRCYRSC